MEEEDKKWYAGLGIALTNDIYDIIRDKDEDSVFSLGLDLLTTFTLFPLLKGKKATLTLTELIPGTGYLPTHTVALLWSWRDEKRLEEQEIS